MYLLLTEKDEQKKKKKITSFYDIYAKLVKKYYQFNRTVLFIMSRSHVLCFSSLFIQSLNFYDDVIITKTYNLSSLCTEMHVVLDYTLLSIISNFVLMYHVIEVIINDKLCFK
jgi:hypothetical protein